MNKLLNFKKFHVSSTNISNYSTAYLFSIDSKMETKTVELINRKKEIMESIIPGKSNDDVACALDKSFLQYSWHTNLIENVEPSAKQIRKTKMATEAVQSQFQFGQLDDAIIIHTNNIFMEEDNQFYRGGNMRIRCPDGSLVYKSPFYEVPQLMKEFISYMNTEGEKWNPVLGACLFKLLLVSVHPFKDGNGRTSRAFLNGILRQNDFPYVSIPTNEIEEYYNVLNQFDKDKRNVNPYLEYMCSCVARSLESYAEDLKNN